MHNIAEMPDRIATFLLEETGRSATVVNYEPMSGGYSRLMARADIVWDDGTSEHVVLRGDPPPGKAMVETDRALEWRLLSTLTAAAQVSMPAARWFDASGDRLGTTAIVIDFCAGSNLQRILNDADPADLEQHALDLATAMGRLHSTDVSSVSAILATPESSADRLNQMITSLRTIEDAALEAEPIVRYAAGYLAANPPPPAPLTIVHGDFQPANIIVEADGSYSVVDWEFCRIGDPREDLAYYVNYASALGPDLYRHDPEAFLARYREVTGFSEEAINPATVDYFTPFASAPIWGSILAGAGAMAKGTNSGLMTTYTLNALTFGRGVFLNVCNEFDRGAN